MPGSWSAVLSGVSGTLVAGVGVSSSAAAAALSTASFGCGIEAPDYRMLLRWAQSLEIRSRGRKRQTLSAGRNRVEVLPQCVKSCGETSSERTFSQACDATAPPPAPPLCAAAPALRDWAQLLRESSDWRRMFVVRFRAAGLVQRYWE